MKIPVRTIQKSRSEVFAGEDCLARFGKSIFMRNPGSGIYILTDVNTRQHCLPVLFEHLPVLKSAAILDAGLGEEAKTVENAGRLWSELIATEADRHSLLINLGGGVITDLGGFVAAGYQRGIRVIHIPTTLIGQVDAALGGKTAVNLGHVKNQVGFYYAPAFVLLFPEFLKTLPPLHLRSGMAELGKNLLLGDPRKWKNFVSTNFQELLAEILCERGWKNRVIPAARYKLSIVKKDYYEKNLRKVLNFGHTVGHALESLFLERGTEVMLHGNAVAHGMVCAAWLSGQKAGLNQHHIDRIGDFVKSNFGVINLDANDREKVIGFIRSDKKNKAGIIRFTLLHEPGDPVTDVPCSEEEIMNSLNFGCNC